MHYYLMNKDKAAARLEIDRDCVTVVEQMANYLPYGFYTGLSWTRSRAIAGERSGMGWIMRQLHIDRGERLIRDTHLVSLNDTFWVKAEDEELSWADVSPYSNPLDQTLADAFFDGPSCCEISALRNRERPSNSPEPATGGQYPKCWERGEDGQIRLYKAGVPLYRGQEGPQPYSEALAAQMLAAAGVDHVPYTLAERNGKLASVCPLFTSEDVGFVPARAFFDDLYTVGDLFDLAAGFGSEELWCEMIVADALTANVDRHDGNWGFLVHNETGEPLRMAPLFDHNLALMPGLEEGNDLEEYLARLTPRIGGDFITTARAALTPAIREKFERLWEWEFSGLGWGCPEWRVDAANKLLKRQLKAVLVSN